MTLACWAACIIICLFWLDSARLLCFSLVISVFAVFAFFALSRFFSQIILNIVFFIATTLFALFTFPETIKLCRAWKRISCFIFREFYHWARLSGCSTARADWRADIFQCKPKLFVQRMSSSLLAKRTNLCWKIDVFTRTAWFCATSLTSMQLSRVPSIPHRSIAVRLCPHVNEFHIRKRNV